MEEGVDEVGCVAVVGELGAAEVADRLPDGASNNDAGDEDEGVSASSNEERQHVVPVKDIADDNVKGSNTGLL